MLDRVHLLRLNRTGLAEGKSMAFTASMQMSRMQIGPIAFRLVESGKVRKSKFDAFDRFNDGWNARIAQRIPKRILKTTV